MTGNSISQPSITYDLRGRVLSVVKVDVENLPKLIPNLKITQEKVAEAAAQKQEELAKKIMRKSLLKATEIVNTYSKSATRRNSILKNSSFDKQALEPAQNLNIRENMKAGVGICIKEDNFRESGPSYEK